MKEKETKLNVIQHTTCFNEHKKHNICCMKKSCKNWIELQKSVNCTLVVVQDGSKTLQEIGNLFGLTRMRICQVEKEIMKKIRNITM